MNAQEIPSVRVVFRAVLVVVAVAIALYLLYRLRQPIGWLLLATFLAVALSGPVNRLSRRMPRGLAIAAVYLGLLLVPVMIGAVVVPPLVTETNNLAQDVPEYVTDLEDFVRDNEQLREINEDYQITEKLQEEAAKLPAKLGDAAGTLRDVGIGVVSSLFALVTILVLSAFMLGSGRHWIDAALALQPPGRAKRLRRVLDNAAKAVSGYVAGALSIAFLAGLLSYIVMVILGVPFAPALAVLVGLFALIPLIGATIAAVLVGVVTLFNDFPTATIIWTIWAIGYQQLENHLIQPQVQKRAVDVHPFIVVTAVLFGAALLGIVGALVAIPVAATIQIAIREWWDWRHGGEPPPTEGLGGEPPPEGEPPPPEPAPAPA